MEVGNKKYDLEERTAVFAEQARNFCLLLPKNLANREYIPQLVRSSSSPGANYIEANECLGTKDFAMKIRTWRREAKESKYWLRLVLVEEKKELEDFRQKLRQEAHELVLIFSAILKGK